MSNSKTNKLIDLVEEIKKVDKMISAHIDEVGDNVMLPQYQAKKNKLTSLFINELNAPSFRSASGFLMIRRLLEKFYPDHTTSDSADNSDLKKVAAAL